MRYSGSIAIYALVVAGFMAWAATGPYSTASRLASLSVLIALQPITGFAVGRWWAILLAVLLPILAAPVPATGEEIPMWFVMLFAGLPVGAALIEAGVGVRKVWDSWRTSPLASR